MSNAAKNTNPEMTHVYPLLANMKPVEMVLRYFYHAPDVNEKHSLIEKHTRRIILLGMIKIYNSYIFWAELPPEKTSQFLLYESKNYSNSSQIPAFFN